MALGRRHAAADGTPSHGRGRSRNTASAHPWRDSGNPLPLDVPHLHGHELTQPIARKVIPGDHRRDTTGTPQGQSSDKCSALEGGPPAQWDRPPAL